MSIYTIAVFYVFLRQHPVVTPILFHKGIGYSRFVLLWNTSHRCSILFFHHLLNLFLYLMFLISIPIPISKPTHIDHTSVSTSVILLESSGNVKKSMIVYSLFNTL